MKIFKLLKFAFLLIFILALSFGYRIFGVKESDHQTKVSKVKHFLGIGTADANFPHDVSDGGDGGDGAGDDDS